MAHQTSAADWEDSSLLTLFRSPFLIPSVLFHTLLFLLALRAATLPIAKTDDTPISVQLVEIRDGGSTNKSIGSGSGPGGPRALPKLGTPTAPAQRVGKLDSGSIETSVPSTNPVETAPPPKPITLPGPKVLAAEPRAESVNAKETAADSLVRLPTKESPTNLPGSSAADLDAHQRTLAALKGAGEGPGIKALKEGTQIPGALRGTLGRADHLHRRHRDQFRSLRCSRRKPDRIGFGRQRDRSWNRRRQHDWTQRIAQRGLQSISSSTQETS